MSNERTLDPSQGLPPAVAHDRGLALLTERLGQLYRTVANTDFARAQTCPYTAADLQRRLDLGLSYYERRLIAMVLWLHCSLEENNFTYDLNPRNRRHLAHFVSVIAGRPAEEIDRYLLELDQDQALQAHYARAITQYGQVAAMEARLRVGRRAGWYALVRASKPKIVVETGVERGHGALTLAAALLRNRAEGYPGQYFGTEIRQGEGRLLCGPYAEVGQILYGDSITTLERFPHPIDLFINDSDHSADYEAREYRVIDRKLSPAGVILGDNAHVTDALLDFARDTGRQYLFFHEDPANHWYPGAGIGAAFRSGGGAR
jgi:predicted O-methyltransferase YrrM